MKKLILFITIFMGWQLAAQVGIGTKNPQGYFHIDGNVDNPAVGTPTTTQQLNDFIVTDDGKVGIGTNTPTNSLEINSGVEHVSGLTLSRLLNTSPTEESTILGIDANGKVVNYQAKEFDFEIYTNSDNPNTATIFDSIDPPVTHNPTFVQNVSNLYSDSQGNVWVWDPETNTYKRKVLKAGTAWKLYNGNRDAYGNKGAYIWRNGRVGIGFRAKTIQNQNHLTLQNNIAFLANESNQYIIMNPTGFVGRQMSFRYFSTDVGSPYLTIRSADNTTDGVISYTNSKIPVLIHNNADTNTLVVDHVSNESRVGILKGNPITTLDVNGSVAAKIRQGSGTVANDDYTLIASGNIILPNLISEPTNGRILNICADSNLESIISGNIKQPDIVGSVKLNDAAITPTHLRVKCYTFQAFGNFWWVIATTQNLN